MNAYTIPPKASHIPLRKKITANALNDFDAVMGPSFPFSAPLSRIGPGQFIARIPSYDTTSMATSATE
jgi:hypothetical protein